MWHAPHTPSRPGYLRYAGQMLRITLTADQQKNARRMQRIAARGQARNRR